MTPEDRSFYDAKHQWMLQTVPTDGKLRLSDGRELSLFVGTKPEETGPKYLVIVLPGGGYEFCSFSEDHIVGRYFARAGMDAVTLNYPNIDVDEARASGRGIASEVLHAVGSLIKELRTRSELGFAQHKIVLCGFSAGGHLAASMCTLYQHELLSDLWGAGGEERNLLRPDGAILCYPVISADPGLAHEVTFTCFTGSAAPQAWAPYSCECNVTAATPPMFIWHTATDTSVAVGNSLVMAQALWQHGVPCELQVKARGEHGASLACDEIDPGIFSHADPYLEPWFNAAVTFVRTFVR